MGEWTECEFKAHPCDQLAINTIRFLSVDAIETANSGHPGLPLGAAPMHGLCVMDKISSA